MCLTIEREDEVKTAEEDIVVYKRLKRRQRCDISPLKKCHGMSFKGVITGINCKGKISICNNAVYFCTNNELLNGNVADSLMRYKYSWAYDGNVTSCIIDGEEYINEKSILMTPYQDFPVEIGSTYTSNLFCDGNSVFEGLHSFEDLEFKSEYDYNDNIFVKCIIPKGSNYYKGKFDDYISYASDTLTYLEIIE